MTNTTGLNCTIKDLQTDIYNALDDLYDFDIEGYGLIERTPKDGRIIPEVWNEGTKQYDELYLDDSKPYSFYFIDGTNHTTNDGIAYNAPLKIVVIVDLTEIDSTSRDQSRAHRDLSNIIFNDTCPFTIEGLEKTIDEVFAGFKTDQIILDDMQPWHIFAIRGTVRYELKTTCNG